MVNLLNRRLKLRHLVLVVAIAEQGSVLRAAEHLHLGQPAATRALREVEQILAVPLFVRGPRGVTPTMFGEAFVEHARRVLGELHRAEARIKELADGEVGTVTVGTLMAGSNVLLPRAISALKAQRPGVTVVVEEATLDAQVPRLIAGEIDMIVGRLKPIEAEPALRQITLYSEPVRLVARIGHPAHHFTNATLVDLLSFPWVFPLKQTDLRSELELVFRTLGLTLPVNRVECTSILTMRALLCDNDMVAAMPDLVARTDPNLASLPVNLPSVRRSVGVTLLAQRPATPSARLMLEHLQAQVVESD